MMEQGQLHLLLQVVQEPFIMMVVLVVRHHIVLVVVVVRAVHSELVLQAHLAL